MWYNIGFPSMAVKADNKQEAVERYLERLAAWGRSAEDLDAIRAEIEDEGIEKTVTDYVQDKRNLWPKQVDSALFWADIDHAQDGKNEKVALFEGPWDNTGREVRKWKVIGYYADGCLVDYRILDEDGDTVLCKDDVE